MLRPSTALLALFSALLVVSGCAPAAPSTPFIPPAPPARLTPTSPPSALPVATRTPLPIPSPAEIAASPSPTLEPVPGPCTNGLSYIQDLTIPDGTILQPGAAMKKEWLVSNSGSCNWDASYRLKFTLGDLLGANAEQALYPARAGTQATLRINFIVPMEPGPYQSAWQAFAPDGTPFGDTVYMTFNVGF